MTVTKTGILDLAPTAANPRSSEGAFLTLADGRILFAYSRYAGSHAGDHAYAEIAGIYSSDGGKTFSEPKIFVRPEVHTGDDVLAGESEEINCMSVSLMRMNNGDIGLFYLVKHRGIWSEYILRRSADGGETWSDGVLCSPPYKGYYVINNDRVLRTQSGRLLVPLANHPTAMLYRGQRDSVRMHSYAVFTASDDDGRTWHQISEYIMLTGGGKSSTGLQEPGVCELPGGTLYANFRTDTGWQYESVSIDGGASWFAPQPSRFPSPESPMLIKRNPYSGQYAAVYNPVPLTYGRSQHNTRGAWTGGRNPLVIAFSDDGVHFSSPIELENDPEAGFCYPALHFTSENTALIAYCAGGVGKTDESCLVRTRIAQIAW
ncbi:MAG: exo-alpha-sialidase [Clostridia bacterium]|nr:exo-alpha-sialidase [Clostridia bacterium]